MIQAFITEDELKKISAWQRKCDKAGGHVPFLGHRDTWKIGRRHIYRDPDTGQFHLLASDLELRVFVYLKFKFKDAVFETQVPMLPLESTVAIANEIGVIHPRDWKTNNARTMTTDLVMQGTDRKTNRRGCFAIYVKYFDGLYREIDGEFQMKRRERQKIEIAKKLHENERNEQFLILTDREVSKETAYSINWLRVGEHENTFGNEDVISFLESFLGFYTLDRLEILNDLLMKAARNLGTTFKRSLKLFRFCGLNHYLPIDVSKRITLSTKIELLDNASI